MNADLKLFLQKNGVISVAEAKAIGISRALLSLWAEKGTIQRVAQGVYASANEIPDELAIIAGRSQSIVFSHETALALHRLHNRVPLLPALTLPTGSRLPRSLDRRVAVYHVKREFHNLGKNVVVSFQGHPVPCYDIERTMCDIIRSRSRMDPETYSTAVRNYGMSPRKNLPLLFKYASLMGIEAKVHRVMEVFE